MIFLVGQNENAHLLGVGRVHSFDVAPAVYRLTQNLDYKNVMPNDFEEAWAKLTRMIDPLKIKYDLIFIDNRAGYDELVAASYLYADASICVEEADSVSRITSSNLIRQLENMEYRDMPPIYRLVNKSDRKLEAEINVLGSIPFDQDVMRYFGTALFWSKVLQSLVEPNLVAAWNNFCRKEGLKQELESKKLYSLPTEFMEENLSYLETRSRILVVFGCFMAFLGLASFALNSTYIRQILNNPFQVLGILVTLFGITTILLGLLRVGNSRRKAIIVRDTYRQAPKSSKSQYASRNDKLKQ